MDSQKEEKIEGRYFLNSKESIIRDSLEGQCLCNPDIIYYPQYNIVIDKRQLEITDQVRLVCGGGSGHEPAHGGYVLNGMLTCAVCGDIFSSPSCANIIKAIEKIYNDNGVIIIVKNYMGDIINFSLACELFKSQNKKVEMVIVDDDISLTNLNKPLDKDNNFNKRRGLCGTVLLYKILGNLARGKKTFEEILTFAKNLIPSFYTVGVSLTTCIPPSSHISKNDLIVEGEFELGLGIHGEKGKERYKYEKVDEIIKIIFDKCFLTNIKKEVLDNMKDIVIIINNLGSLTPIEMNIIVKSLINYIKNTSEKKFSLPRIIFGTLMTSLDMKGFSLTICNLNENKYLLENVASILDGIDSPVNVPSLLWGVIKSPLDQLDSAYKCQILFDKGNTNKEVQKDENSKTKKILKELFELLLTKKDFLNDLDKKVGDGDIGTGLFNAIKKAKENYIFDNYEKNLKNSIYKLGEYIGTGFGGTSGPLYMSFLMRVSAFLKEEENENNFENICKGLNEGVKMIMNVGKAKVGDRTMLDYLVPISEGFLKCKSIEEIKKFFQDNRNGLLENVKKLKSNVGRSSYLDGKEIGNDEPGCVLVDLWLNFVLEKI